MIAITIFFIVVLAALIAVGLTYLEYNDPDDEFFDDEDY